MAAGSGASANLESWNSINPMNGAIFRIDLSHSLILNIITFLLSNVTSNLLQFRNTGGHPPGTKIVLYSDLGPSSSEYALGIVHGTLW